MMTLSSLWQDMRYGVRNLRLSPGFALAALATLTLTIGASTAAFSIVNGILLEPLQFEEPNRLVNLSRTSGSDQRRSRGFTSLEVVSDLGARLRTLEGLAAERSSRANLDEAGPPELVEFTLVTAGYFELLGVQPFLGRLFAAEPLPDGTTPALISHGYWQGRWGGSREVIGKTLQLGEQPLMTIIGILPETFRMPFTAALPTSVWVPVDTVPKPVRASFNYNVLGRLRPGETLASAQAELEVVATGMAEGASESERVLTVRPLSERVVGLDARRTVLIFAAAVGIVLLIGVLNLVNLQASRISRRQGELSIRAALGASRSRLICQMVAEAMVLTTSGAALGFLIVYLIRDLALANMPAVLPRMADIPVDGGMFVFAVVLALISGLCIGIVPAFRASRPDMNEMLKEGTPGTTEGRHERWFRGVLTIAQTSLAVVLLVGAGLLIHSFWRLISVDPGFDPENLMVARISLSRLYADPTTRNVFIGRLLEDVRLLPGVESASVANQLPMGGQGALIALVTNGEDRLGAIPTHVSAEFGRVMRLPLLAGRWFTESEVANGTPAVVVSESLARFMWPGQSPIGQRFERLDPEGTEPNVVGVVGDGRLGMRLDLEAGFYAPYTTFHVPPLLGRGIAITLAARLAEGAVVNLRRAILQVEPNSTVTVNSMEDLIGDDVERERFQTAVLTSFAAAALVLAMLGVYSVVAFSTAQRTREIGLRMALGARARDVVAQMMRKGAIPAVVGLAIGLAASSVLTRFLESYLFEIEPAESWTYAAIVVVGLMLAFLASWLPARRAARVDPITALRY